MKEEQTKLKANIKRKINILVENIEIRKKNVVRVAQQSRLHVRNEKMIRKKKTSESWLFKKIKNHQNKLKKHKFLI